jgi:hypothetical protein
MRQCPAAVLSENGRATQKMFGLPAVACAHGIPGDQRAQSVLVCQPRLLQRRRDPVRRQGLGQYLPTAGKLAAGNLEAGMHLSERPTPVGNQSAQKDGRVLVLKRLQAHSVRLSKHETYHGIVDDPADEGADDGPKGLRAAQRIEWRRSG